MVQRRVEHAHGQWSRRSVGRVLSPGAATELVGTHLTHRPADVTEAGVYEDADTGAPAFAYLPLDRELTARLRRHLVGWQCSHQNIKRNANYSTKSTTFGFTPRAAINRREGCQLTAFARDQAEREAALDDAANALQRMMIDIDPAVVARDRSRLAVIESDWFLGDQELWTSGVINQSSQLPYHRDSFNFPTWSAMPVLRRGMDGGYLHIPEYNATIACRDGWAVFFPGHDLVHGVTPMRARTKDAYRYSVVYYALRGMKDCHTAAEETAYARRRRMEREIAMASSLRVDAGGRPTGPAVHVAGPATVSYHPEDE